MNKKIIMKTTLYNFVNQKIDNTNLLTTEQLLILISEYIEDQKYYENSKLKEKKS